MKKLIVLLLAAATLLPASHALAVTKFVSINDFYFLPRNDTISVGDQITWSNDSDLSTHTSSRAATPNSWDSTPLGPGGTYTLQFNTAGTFPYKCNFHPTLMTGTIVVKQAATPARGNTWGGLRKTYRKAAPASKAQRK